MEEDKRFSHIATDPKFRRIPRNERKVKIDKRFKSMFKDKQFKVKYTIDKRGRPINTTSNEDLKRYYELSSGEGSSDSESNDDDEEPGKSTLAPSLLSKNENNEGTEVLNQLDIEDKTDKKISDKVKRKLRNLNIDYARGESTLFSESSSDEDESDADGDNKDETLEHAWGELDKDAERTEEATCRLAACNMDWDRIRAVDMMVLLNSFLPPGGLIKSVTIYPSEFGFQRMKEEDAKGPSELVESQPLNKEKDEDDDDTEGPKYHMEKLRQYQLNRLKYYYAVIVCDSESTANKIYSECDGLEYESSATKMDLRFIPDDMVFDQEPKEACEKLPEPGKYQPRFFTTTALQQAKVNLTWDETNPERIEIAQKLVSGKVDDVTDADLQAYLASSSDEDDKKENESEDEESPENDENSKLNSLDKYRALLQDIEGREKEKGEKDVEMEITWGIDVKAKTEKLVKKKLDEKMEQTPFQQFLEKRKEKKKAKREENRKKSQNDQDSEDDSDIPSDIDMNDPYFAEEFDKPEFKKKKKNNKQIGGDEDSADDLKKAELELLLGNDQEDVGRKHFSLKKIQERENKKTKNKLKNKKAKNDDEIGEENNEDDFKINVGDERFSALYSSHHFNVDPTDPRYKKTKAMEAIVNEKLKRKNNVLIDEEVQVKKTKNKTNSNRDPELSVLIKSVKRKTEMLGNKKKK